MEKEKWMSRKQRRAIIAAIDVWCEENGTHLLMIGNRGERADYAPAILGLAGHPARPAVIYSYPKLIECFMHVNGWSYESAVEWVSFNTIRGLEYEKQDNNPPIIMEELDHE